MLWAFSLMISSKFPDLTKSRLLPAIICRACRQTYYGHIELFGSTGTNEELRVAEPRACACGSSFAVAKLPKTFFVRLHGGTQDSIITPEGYKLDGLIQFHPGAKHFRTVKLFTGKRPQELTMVDRCVATTSDLEKMHHFLFEGGWTNYIALYVDTWDVDNADDHEYVEDLESLARESSLLVPDETETRDVIYHHHNAWCSDL